MSDGVARYLVTWGKNEEFMEPFNLWRDASLWHKTVTTEGDGPASILYWHEGHQRYLEAAMPPPALDIIVIPMYAALMRKST